MIRNLPWLAAALVVTILAATGFAFARYVDRSQADDAPWRLATQVAAEIQGGTSTTVDAASHIDLSRSLETWVVVEDAQGRATSGSGYLKNVLVSLPSETLADAAHSGRKNLTWEPTSGKRFATVTVPVGDQFVSAGQSLAPSDGRLGSLWLIVAVGWLASLVVLGLAFWFVGRRAVVSQPAD